MKYYIGDCFHSIRNGANIKQGVVDGGYPITRIETLSGGVFNYEKVGFAGIHDLRAYQNYVLRDGDILMSHINSFSYLGRTVCFKETAVPYIHGMNLLRLQPIHELIDSDYFCFYCQSHVFKEQIRKIAKKSVNQASFSVTDLKKIAIELPSLEEQKHLADKLRKVNSLKSHYERVIAELDKLIKSRFVEMFGDPQFNEKGFVKAPMGLYLTVLTDFSSNGSYKTLDNGVVMYEEPNYAWMVRTTDLETGDMSSVKFIDKEAYELLSKSKVYGGEIIMNKIGSAGKIYMMPKVEMPASLGRNAFLFRYDDRINTRFLYELLSSPYGEAEINQYVRGAVTKTITKDDVRSVMIIVPPRELQDAFAEFTSQVDKSKSVIQKSLDEAQLLFDSLMQEYFG